MRRLLSKIGVGLSVFGLVTGAMVSRAHAWAPQCLPPDDEIDAAGRGPSSERNEKKRKPAQKQEPAKNPNWNGITVIQLDRDAPVETLASEGFEIRTADEMESIDPWQEPSPALRDRLFRDAELTEHVRGWSQLEKDMLFLRAQEYGIKHLRTKYYPTMPQIRLEALRHLIRIGKKAKGRDGS